MKKSGIIIVTAICAALVTVFLASLCISGYRVAYGDVNSDGKVNGKDATLLLKYLADWNVNINDKNANCDANDAVNGKDATLLLKYLADWKVSLGADWAVVRDADDVISTSVIKNFAANMRKKCNVRTITDNDEEEYNHEIVFGENNSRLVFSLEEGLPDSMYYIAKKNGNMYASVYSLNLLTELWEKDCFESIPEGAVYYYSREKDRDTFKINGTDISDYVIYSSKENYEDALSLRGEIFRYTEIIVPITTDKNTAAEHMIIIGGDTAGAGVTVEKNLSDSMYYIAENSGNVYIGAGSTEQLMNMLKNDTLDDIPAGTVKYYSTDKKYSAFTVNESMLSDFTIYADENNIEAARYIRSEIFRFFEIILPISTASSENENAIIISEIAGSNTIDFSVSGSKINLLYSSDIGADAAALVFVKNCLHSLSDTVSFTDADSYRNENASFVTYEQFGAKGDGVTDDFEAIKSAHTYANENHLPVVTKIGAVYYLQRISSTIPVRTDVDWTGTEFILDNSSIENYGANKAFFTISSYTSSYTLKYDGSISKGQTQLDVTFEKDVMVMITDSEVVHFIRSGKNVNSGEKQRESVIVHPDGTVDESTTIIWNYEKVAKLTVYPIDTDRLTIRGGSFTEYVTDEPYANDSYIGRGISFARSNMYVCGMTHTIAEQPETGSRYDGFYKISNCANVTFENCVASGRRWYNIVKTTGVVAGGTYDIRPNNIINCTFKNFTQANSITDETLWGIIGGNYCRNLTFDDCSLSRIDAHKGIINLTVKNSVIGHGGISVVGDGTLLLENTEFVYDTCVSLRNDYGSTWNGKIVLNDCTWSVPKAGNYTIVNGYYTGDWYYGYDCYLPNVEINNFHLNNGDMYSSVAAVYHPSIGEGVEYPMILSEYVTVNNYTYDSGEPMILAFNTSGLEEISFTSKSK